MLSYGVHDLPEGGVLPGIGRLAYDVSAAVPLDSWYGTLLKGVFNFSPAATWLEVAVWVAYVAIVGTCFVLALRRRPVRRPVAAWPPRTDRHPPHPHPSPSRNSHAFFPPPPRRGDLRRARARGLRDDEARSRVPHRHRHGLRRRLPAVGGDRDERPRRLHHPQHGPRSTEFELLAADGATIAAEVENLAPGLTRTLTLTLAEGRYTSLCKPGMSGSSVGRTAFTVTGAGAGPSPSSSQLTAAAQQYRSFVRAETATLLTGTRTFAAAYAAGDDAKAKSLYARTRASYERIEPVAERFGALDAELDAREADVATGATWTGWHRIEKGLWPPAGSSAPSAADRATQAKALVSLTEQLRAKVDAKSFTLTAAEVGNGAIALLDEVAATKITGEEELFSHTDLSDFRANVDGAERAYRGLREVAKAKDPALVTTLDARFAALDTLLRHHGTVDGGFAPYTSLTRAQVKALSDAVNAVSEPLSTLTATVLR